MAVDDIIMNNVEYFVFLTDNSNQINMKITKFDIATLLLRLAGGGLMLTHGIPKLNKALSGNMDFADPLGLGTTPSLLLAIFAEVICSILIIIGLKSRWASVPLIITMLVAVFIVHASDPIGRKEMGLLYTAIYVAIFCLGSGRISLDRR